jgi:hypothetical protein
MPVIALNIPDNWSNDPPAGFDIEASERRATMSMPDWIGHIRKSHPGPYGFPILPILSTGVTPA